MAKPSTAQTSACASAFSCTPFRNSSQVPSGRKILLQSACCLCHSPLVESVSLASGVSHCRGVTYDSLPWAMGASEFVHPLPLVTPGMTLVADVSVSPLNANGAYGVNAPTYAVIPQ